MRCGHTNWRHTLVQTQSALHADCVLMPHHQLIDAATYVSSSRLSWSSKTTGTRSALTIWIHARPLAWKVRKQASPCAYVLHVIVRKSPPNVFSLSSRYQLCAPHALHRRFSPSRHVRIAMLEWSFHHSAEPGCSIGVGLDSTQLLNFRSVHCCSRRDSRKRS